MARSAQYAATGAPDARVRPGVWKIVGTYSVFGVVWILFSDAVLGLLVQDPASLVQISVHKGIVFIGVTAMVLYLVMRRVFAEVEKGASRLQAHKREIERFSRLYQAFSRINHEILTAVDSEQLFSRTCQLLVEQGGFQMAWIGRVGVSSLQPEAMAGEGVDAVVRDLADDAELNMGSVGWQEVIERAVPMVSNDFSSDYGMRHRRDLGEEHGVRSRAALPMLERGEVVAVLSVYASEANFFRGNELSLLQEVVVDVSLALDRFAFSREREQAELLAARELAFSQAMIDSMPGILYFYDESGRFLRWNRNFETVTGYSADEIAHMHPLDFFTNAEKPLLEQRIDEVMQTGEAAVEADFLAQDGSTTPYFFTGRALEFDGARCLVGVGVDITERKRAENAMRDLNASLEQRVMERTQQLESAVVRAEAADRLKSAFLATMSHELRTPLNSIIGFTGILLQELAGPLNEEQARQLNMVQVSARHLLDLINDVLDLSKIEAGQLEVRAEAFDLQESLERGAAVRVRVRDTGIGIRREDLPRLFQPFTQLEAGLIRQHEGTGLGLMICRRLVDLMGGEITARSEWKTGSEFTFTLPTTLSATP